MKQIKYFKISEKINLFLVILFIFCFNNLSISQNKNDTLKKGLLTVVIVGLENSRGDIQIGLFSSEESYKGKKEKYKGAIVKIKDRKAKWIVDSVPYGFYAIKAFHDENSDDKINANFIGMPIESYGFSNNVTSLWGMPGFNVAKFQINTSATKIEINLK